MKLLFAALLLLSTMIFASGCATPAYSGGLPTIQFPDEKPTGENANNVLLETYFSGMEQQDVLARRR
jgi:hypothetical protein